MYLTVVNQVFILLLIILVGIYTKKRNILNETVRKKLSELVLHITSPLLIISSFQIDYSKEILENAVVVFIFSLAAHTTTALVSIFLFKGFEESKKKIMKLSIIYSNCGFMGFPLLESLFGKVGVLYGSLYVAVFNIFLWTHGIMVFSGINTTGKISGIDKIRKALFNPGIISVLIGIPMFVFSIKLPSPLAKTIELIGSITVPLSMLIIGANLAENNLKKLLRGWDLYYITALRLIIIPLFAYGILKLLGFSGMLLSICTLLVAMPVAATTSIFAEIYGGDDLFASRVVAFSTLASLVTVPLIMLLH